MTAAAFSPKARARRVSFWLLKIVLALLFLAAGSFKLIGAPMMVAEFSRVGLGQWFRLFTGVSEIAGALLLLWPATTGFGAGLLTCICVGAFFAQWLILHGDVIHALVLSLILGAVAWSSRKAMMSRIFG
jgi:putative oxidoreductase